jgi:DNA-3-methyladenine glycosylase
VSLPPAFYDRPVVEVAQELVGCVVEHEGCAGVIVETEAYHFSEPACHAYIGVTDRTEVLHRPPGTAYVYRSYGIHALLNAVCEPEGVGAAVLIRALEPVEGVELMRERRGVARDVELCNGPGKLTQALGIELELNGTRLSEGPIVVHGREDGWPDPALVAGPRIGITKAAELPWRFCAAGSRCVSRPWPPGFRATLGARVVR